jgi:uncharacterized protein YndB with AHSA1/START domain
MKILLLSGLVLGTVILMVVLVGALLPVRHQASRTAELRAPEARVWELISDFGRAPAWRTDLRSVEPVPGRESVWKETARNGEVIEYETLEVVPERRLVRRIASQGLPFGGTWTFELSSAAGQTRLTITERGEVYNPVFRFVSRFLMGHAATIDRYLKALRAGLGEA